MNILMDFRPEDCDLVLYLALQTSLTEMVQ